MPAVYQNREWRELREEEFGEWSSVRFETNADGTVAAMQLDFSPKGDPYDELVHVGWVMNEVLEPLLPVDTGPEKSHPPTREPACPREESLLQYITHFWRNRRLKRSACI